ncbi:histidine kinase [Corynebacterium aquilae DSM 44791]|uniref:histidine kinase n=1 Tax=Corynebacterium aquilae DSM 44791 TaxID=1431546 RepID=A0A1L7CHX1_9CORY|nr:histidine kinase [Corynebacterium aquilae DSM 44791]
MPLRTLLLVVVVVLSGVGMGAASVAVDGIMRDFVYSRVDEELLDAANGWARRGDFFSQNTPRPPSSFFVAKIMPDGTTLILNDSSSAPKIENLPVDAEPVTVPAAEGSASAEPWRVIAVADKDATTIVGRDTANENHLLARLALVQWIIGTIVLILLAIVGFVVIRRSLKPLRTVEEVAKRISAGDLDRRVPAWPAGTEVGQLSEALNIMLARLQQSIVESGEKEEQMRRFVGDASHELRTPLTSVRGFAELYRSGAAPDADYVLTRIEDEADRMSVLVEDLLALTRAEGNKLAAQPVDLLDVAVSVATSLRVAHPDRIIKVHSDCDEIPVVLGDEGRLRQVVTNLVNNALVHAGPDAEVTVGLCKDEDYTTVTVADNGVGMSEQDTNHVFERFYRADASRNRNSGGSGLGLAIVKSLVEAHGGVVNVVSAPGEGTTFSVKLPNSAAIEQ